MVTEQSVKDLFKKMQKAGWDMNNEHVWGYFFKDTSQNKLILLGKHLEDQGFKLIDINQSFPDERYWLHIEKQQVHTVQSLNQLNNFFQHLCAENNVLAYDGMDISPVNF